MTRATSTPETVTLHVPFRVVKRGGQKKMQLPDGAAQPRSRDDTLVRALARAFRWRRLLEAGEFASINELAEAENISRSYISRLLQLTLLAPDIAEAILGGRREAGAMLPQLLQSLPVEWERQRQVLSDEKGDLCGSRSSFGPAFSTGKSEAEACLLSSADCS